MKKLLLSAFALTMIILISSCSDDEKKNGGSVTLDGTKHTFNQAFIESRGSGEDGDIIYSEWLLVLTSEGLTYNGGEDLNGSGDFAYMYLIAINKDNNETLPAGTYYYDGNVEEGESIVDDMGIGISFDSEAEENDQYPLDESDVVVKVEKSGSRYAITVTITQADESTIVVKYSGVLSPVVS